MNQNLIALKPNARGETRVVYRLKWDPILDNGSAAEHDEIKRAMDGFMFFQGGAAGGLARRVPALMRLAANTAAKLVDLEAVVLILKGKEVFGYVDGAYAYALDGGIYHTGDDMMGGFGPFDEEAAIDLAKLPADVTALALVVDSVNGHTLGRIRGAYCQLAEGRSSDKLAEFDIDASNTDGTTHLFGLIRRQDTGFAFEAVNHSFSAKTHDDVAAVLARFVQSVQMIASAHMAALPAGWTEQLRMKRELRQLGQLALAG